MSRKKWEARLWGDHGPVYGVFAKPLALLYGNAARVRAGLYKSGVVDSYKSSIKVVSVGNLTLGGSGKTPLVMELARSFMENGLKPAIITRGYGGRIKDGAVVVKADSDPADMGDEPVMMAAMTPDVPVIKSPRRKDGAEMAETVYNADIVLLDDGFGHLGIGRDFDILVVDAARGFGNGEVVPYGPLREPLSQLKRADCVVVTGSEKESGARLSNIKKIVETRAPGMEVITAVYKTVGLVKKGDDIPESTETIAGEKVVAFSGIGNPLSFTDTLEKIGVDPVESIEWPDHHYYTDEDLARVADAVSKHKARYAVTTEKDLARLAGKRPRGTEVVAPRINLEVDRLEWMIDNILEKK